MAETCVILQPILTHLRCENAPPELGAVRGQVAGVNRYEHAVEISPSASGGEHALLPCGRAVLDAMVDSKLIFVESLSTPVLLVSARINIVTPRWTLSALSCGVVYRRDAISHLDVSSGAADS